MGTCCATDKVATPEANLEGESTRGGLSAQDKIRAVTKFQALWRGHKVRKIYAPRLKSKPGNGVGAGRPGGAANLDRGEILSEMPDYHNEHTSEAMKKLEAFIYDQDHLIESGVVKKPPIKLESGAVYEGTWLNGVRHGKGVQVWVDGSR
eukprot:CAMPEP_0115019620 /NCGR_PEP_ID=MMETSP0216-20121206/29566_1 /TAXON_ID=223996 /ORGANISM="Protocruzia adherens, Strain Boccale" /LENGTH=149 /DNA_ID=CAMNT_0002391153 /DNA_START=573 /DNA_END=1018 /DNA_ORIENTATION=-